MGAAFENINLGPGFAYFPAVSLSQGESVRLNFGSTPYMYSLQSCLSFNAISTCFVERYNIISPVSLIRHLFSSHLSWKILFHDNTSF